jgi:hypothetical protein
VFSVVFAGCVDQLVGQWRAELAGLPGVQTSLGHAHLVHRCVVVILVVCDIVE